MRANDYYTFAQVPTESYPRSVFNAAHQHKTTFDSGYLVPFYLDEVLPGDTFTAKTTIFARLSTPIVPIMDNLYLETFYFFVPNRIIWEHWVNFCGEQENPDDETVYQIPEVNSNAGWTVNSLGDHFGLPVDIGSYTVNALPFRAYNKIYDDWFRDQNLVDPPSLYKGDSIKQDSDYPLRRRAKRHDYFTSCLPWPQKGDEVLLPLGDKAHVFGTGKSLGLVDNTGSTPTGYGVGYEGTYHAISPVSQAYAAAPGTHITSGTRPTDLNVLGVPTKVQTQGQYDNSGLYADLKEATAASINDIRLAFQMQRMRERDARSGTRYIEILKSQFGVTSPDARLQRSEYLGQGHCRMNINPVQKTSSSDGTSPQGHLAAYAQAVCQDGFSKSFTEHGYVMGLVNVRADLTYQQGRHRMWSRTTKNDFYWPVFAHLGEQVVENREIYDVGQAGNTDPFGYQERWAEYKYFPSQITGKFRSSVSGSLDVWHLAQHFTGEPTLDDTFILENPPISRVVAVNTEPQIIFDSHMELKKARVMPVYCTPGMVDHL